MNKLIFNNNIILTLLLMNKDDRASLLSYMISNTNKTNGQYF